MNELGILSIAQNGEHDYLKMAYFQALMLKKHMPEIPYCIVVDEKTNDQISDKMKNVFDYIKILEIDYSMADTWKMKNEPQVYKLTPFNQTLKLEADLLINKDITHWFNTLSKQDMIISFGCKNFLGKPATSRAYRKLLDSNNLPDLYTGMMYFKRSDFCENFFRIAQDIFLNWEIISKELNYGLKTEPSTDVVYSLVANIVGIEKCSIPSLDFFQFIHMKSRINNWVFPDYHEITVVEIEDQIRLANTNIYDPIHYHEKTFLNDDKILSYESHITKISQVND